MPKPLHPVHQALTLAGHIHTALWITGSVGGGAVIAAAMTVTQRLLHFAVEWSVLAVVFVVSSIMFFGSIWLQNRVNAIRAKAPEPPSAGRTGDELKLCVATLAGKLFSLLFEIGEKPDAPTMTSDQYGESLFGDHPPDPRITSRASKRKIADHLRDAYSCARDLGVLPGCVSWSTSIVDVEDVRSRISELRVLSEALIRRFPDFPALPENGSK
jgi:hypothetical protein